MIEEQRYALTMVTICPKCGKKAWRPYKFVIKGNGGRNYTYLVYRHNEKKRHTPRKCYVAQRPSRKAGGAKGRGTSRCSSSVRRRTSRSRSR